MDRCLKQKELRSYLLGAITQRLMEMSPLTTFVLAFVLSATIIYLVVPLALRYGLVDHPGGHKKHDHQVPLAGGVGIFAAIIAATGVVLLRSGELGVELMPVFVGIFVLFIVGLVDDVKPLGVKFRILVQILVAGMMALWGGVQLADLGSLVPGYVITTAIVAVPLTVFATVGAINAFNMIDGMDGLSGSLAFLSLGFLAVITYLADRPDYLFLLVACMGGVAGFLLFNLRFGGRAKAMVFMGDAGSTVLGFLLAFFLIVLSQGDDRAMTPVTALWIFAIPLIDTVAVMLRRVWLGKSPFYPDHGHIHHLLQDAGFRVRHALNAILVAQFLMGCVGLGGLYAGVDESVMILGFGLVFAGYFYALIRPWRTVPALRRLHRRLDLTVKGVTEVYVGGLPKDHSIQVLQRALARDSAIQGYRLYRRIDPQVGEESTYAVVDVGSADKVHPVSRRLRARLSDSGGIVIRQYVRRNYVNDRRKARRDPIRNHRRIDRRAAETQLLFLAPASNNERGVLVAV